MSGVTKLLSASGEYYVMYRLLQKGMIAALAPAGIPDIDIIVSASSGNTLFEIQVKSRGAGRDGGWRMSKKHAYISRPRLFYFFVDFETRNQELPKCYIIPNDVVKNVLQVTHKKWLEKPGRNGKKHNDHDMRRLLPDYSHLGLKKYKEGWLDDYCERWEQLVTLTP